MGPTGKTPYCDEVTCDNRSDSVGGDRISLELRKFVICLFCCVKNRKLIWLGFSVSCLWGCFSAS